MSTILFMTTLLAYGNIHQSYPLDQIPSECLTDKLRFPAVQMNNKVKQRHRCRWVAHFLLWQLFKQANLSSTLLQQIYYSTNQRPQLAPAHLDFNISHSGDWVAVLLHLSENNAQPSIVGIDIECAHKARDYPSLLDYFASPAEQQWFTQQADKDAAFYRTWCLREAILKSQGVGIVKLAEVQHQPNHLTIQSSYCPQGQLIFSDQFPFYLAFFVNQTCELEVKIFNWNEGRLQLVEKELDFHYKVND